MNYLNIKSEAKLLTFIPDSLIPPFIEWLIRGGHKLKTKKHRATLTKDDMVGVIRWGADGQTHELNAYLSKRFEIFSRQWLKGGFPFINELRISMINKSLASKRQAQIFEMAKVA